MITSGNEPTAHPYSRRAVLGAGALGLGLLGVGSVSAAPAAARPKRAVGSRATGAPKGSPVVDVLDCGAKGDGVTDDVEAFRTAMAQLADAGGGTLEIPAGHTYLINNSVVLTDNISIHSTGATLTKTAGPYSYFVSLSGAKTGYGSGVKNVHAEGLTFHGDFTVPHTGCGFALHHAQDVTVENCQFIETMGTGHCLDLCGCERITVRDCLFEGFNNYLTSGYTKTEAIELDQSRWGALSYNDDLAGLDALFTRDVRVENCRFLPREVAGMTYPCPNPLGAHGSREGHWYEDVVFVGNLVVDPHEDPSTPELDEKNTSSSWKGVTHFPTTRNLTISNNTFRLTQPRSVRAISVFSIDVSDLNSVPPSERPVQGPVDPIASEDVVITENRFEGFMPSTDQPAQEAIWIHGVPGGEVHRVTITGNTFDAGRASDGRGTYAIRALHGRTLSVRDNTVQGSAGGLLLQHTTDFRVTTNEIGAGPGAQLPAAITVTDASDNGCITANTTTGFAAPVDVTGAGTHVTVAGNT